jgi:hypothetical protein
LKQDLLSYLFNLPADFGGLGEVLEDDKYDNLNFFEYKTKSRQLPILEMKEGSVYVPLEINQGMHRQPVQPNNIVNIMGTFNQYMLYNPTFMNEMYKNQQRMLYEANLKKK